MFGIGGLVEEVVGLTLNIAAVVAHVHQVAPVVALVRAHPRLLHVPPDLVLRTRVGRVRQVEDHDVTSRQYHRIIITYIPIPPPTQMIEDRLPSVLEIYPLAQVVSKSNKQ